ncbi:MAG: hypothetical protein OSJ27_07625 [Candidatus Gastranaerophilales bacterium]|nr:hypothetical protein [Candidatus Gastranaerophilales bacterium]
MALLVASLLLAALAPVMTKRMDEAKINISGVGAAQYDKDAIVQVYTEDSVFNVPYDVNSIKLTLMGAGGAGGNAVKGDATFTNPSSVQSWKVPEGVTKLRIFMIGGGGGGASGGVGNGTATIPAGGDGNTYKDFLTAGEHAFTIPSNATAVPAVDERCKASGVSSWTGVSDGKTYTPGKVAVSVTACGGGGGGGSSCSADCNFGGGGGSGGYVQNIQLQGSLPSKIYIHVGGGGGYGASGQLQAGNGGYAAGGGGSSDSGGEAKVGSAGTFGGKGGASSGSGVSSSAKNGSNGQGTLLTYGGYGGYADSSYKGGDGGRGGVWGGGGGGGTKSTGCGLGAAGGGGGPTTILSTSGTDVNNIIFQIGGGGGGGGSVNVGYRVGCGGMGGGGGGGGYGGGGGGGGGSCYGSSYVGNGGNGYAPLSLLGTTISSVQQGLSGTHANSYGGSTGGGGGGGYGGVKGTTGTDSSTVPKGGQIGANTIWKSNSYCDGGNGGNSGTMPTLGKPGALRLYYTYPALKCDYSLPANGGGGGGAGQITVGEIAVTPGETLYFEVGRGGLAQTTAGKKGNAGNPTYIRRGSASGTIIATALGGNAGQYTSSETTQSQGGAKRPVSIVKTPDTTGDGNWLNKTFGMGDYGQGSNGQLASSSGFGGKGGNSQFKDLTIFQGGAGGNSVKNGSSPNTASYGAGGGGGSGTTTSAESAGIGAAGASGYIYIEYGGSNGGGGTAGEFISKRINVKPSTEMTIHIGKGADNANGGETNATYEIGGGKTETTKARGGIRGNDGGMTAGAHGAVKLLIDASGNKLNNYTENEAEPVNGKAGNDTFGGIGGFMQYLYKNADGTDANYVKDRDGKFAGPSVGGCGGNVTSAMECNAQTGGAHGKQGVFGGGGGGGAIVDGVNGTGARGGDGFVIIEYKSTSI